MCDLFFPLQFSSEVCLQLGVGRLAEGLVVLVLLDGLVVLFELVEGLARKGISSLPPPSCSTDLRAARAPAPAPKTHMLAPSTFLQPDHSANDTNINTKYKNRHKNHISIITMIFIVNMIFQRRQTFCWISISSAIESRNLSWRSKVSARDPLHLTSLLQEIIWPRPRLGPKFG